MVVLNTSSPVLSLLTLSQLSPVMVCKGSCYLAQDPFLQTPWRG